MTMPIVNNELSGRGKTNLPNSGGDGVSAGTEPFIIGTEW